MESGPDQTRVDLPLSRCSFPGVRQDILELLARLTAVPSEEGVDKGEKLVPFLNNCQMATSNLLTYFAGPKILTPSAMGRLMSHDSWMLAPVCLLEIRGTNQHDCVPRKVTLESAQEAG